MIRNIILSFAVLATALTATIVPSQSAHAAPPVNKCDETRFLTFPAWYRGITNNDHPDCTLKGPGDMPGAKEDRLGVYIWTIALNILEIMLQVVVYISAGFIIFGGYLYMVSGGDSSGITSAKNTILNAIIGLAISLIAVAIVSFISSRLITP